MSHDFTKAQMDLLLEHRLHEVTIFTYGDEPNVSLECGDCSVVILDADYGTPLVANEFRAFGSAAECEVKMRELTGGERGCDHPEEHES